MVVYTGIHGTLSVAGADTAFAEFSVKINRGVASHPRAGKYSDIKRSGKLEITGTIKRIQSDATMLGRLLNTTALTGTAGTMHSGLTLDGSDTTYPITTPDAQDSRVRLTVVDHPITTAGTITLIGTDINGNNQTETIALTTLAATAYVTSGKVWGTITHATIVDVNSTLGGTLAVASLAGSTNYAVGAASVFDLIGVVEDSDGNSITISAANCFLTDGEFTISDADTILSEPVSWTMQDPDSDFTIDGVLV